MKREYDVRARGTGSAKRGFVWNAFSECRYFLGKKSTFLALMVSALLVACRVLTDPLPENAERFEPPAVFARWWSMTEKCSSTSGDLATVQWYRVPGPLVAAAGEWVAGYYEPRGHRIVIAQDVLDDAGVVRHEMLHALLRTASHPRGPFIDACASVLVCAEACVLEGGGWHPPPSGYAFLSPDSLDVDSQAELLPSEADGQRWVIVRVTANNPNSRAIMIASQRASKAPDTFAADVRGPQGGITSIDAATDSSSLFFKPFETKLRVYEFRVASELSLLHVPPGAHLIRGGYAQHWASYDTVSVSP